MRALLLTGTALLLACAPADTSAHEDVPKSDISWASAPQTQILARDHREFLELVDGTYDNQEQVYFEDNLEFDDIDRHARQNFSISTTDSVMINFPDSKVSFERRSVSLGADRDTGIFSLSEYGTELSIGTCAVTFTRSFDQFIGRGGDSCKDTQMAWSEQGLSIQNAPDALSLMGLSGGVFRRAQIFKCWVSPQKEDGTYGFYNDVMLHDQGGRAWLEGDDHPRVGLKMRNVVWPTGNNRPSLVLYAYQGDDEDKAVSYTWTSPDEPRIGMNLRWMQASCTRGDGIYNPNINLKTGAGSGK